MAADGTLRPASSASSTARTFAVGTIKPWLDALPSLLCDTMRNSCPISDMHQDVSIFVVWTSGSVSLERGDEEEVGVFFHLAQDINSVFFICAILHQHASPLSRAPV